jgi:acetyltransferase
MRRFAADVAALPDDARDRIVAYGAMSAGPVDPELIATLGGAGIPFLAGTDQALGAIARVAAANERLRSRVPGATRRPPRAGAWPDDPRELTPSQMWRLLRAAGIPVAELEIVTGVEQATAAAERIGYPVAVKAASFAVAHKSDAGAVRLGLGSAAAVGKAYRAVAAAVPGEVIVQAMAADGAELLVGILRDPEAGPAVVVGAGGLLVDLLEDAAVAIPPIDRDEAEEMLRALRGHRLLTGMRGSPPRDVAAAVDVLVAAGDVAASMPEWVRAVDLNPVIVHESGATCVDVWVETDREE